MVNFYYMIYIIIISYIQDITDDDNITVITPKKNDNELTLFIMKLLKKYQLL